MRDARQDHILAMSVEWMTARFDTAVNLLRHPADARVHRVRESLWYAAGLMARPLSKSDADRALTILDAVLASQYDEPGSAWDGTFPRTLEEPRPRPAAIIWRDYDPNWRQFIGCALAVLLRDYANMLGTDRADRLRHAIGLALRGESPERIEPSYSNIALLQAWLLCEYGDQPHGESLAAAIESLFRAEQGFSEYNSPTYYGVDLWALALWRGSRSGALAAAGHRLESALWRDIASFYHPGLRNLCGPYDRTYGMDMTRYASLLGLWLWWGCDARAFPDPEHAFEHAHDFCAAPLLALAAPRIPDDVVVALGEPVGARTVRRIAPQRTVTATLLPALMLGAVAPARADPTGQSRPVTAHWRGEDGAVDWLSIHGAPLSALVSGTTIELASDVELVLESSSVAGGIGGRTWTIGGRRIEADGVGVIAVAPSTRGCRASIRLPSGIGRLRFA